MRLTSKGRYAVTAMLDVALHTETGAGSPLADISERQGISLSYLEQLFARLRKHGLVQQRTWSRWWISPRDECLPRSLSAQVISAVDESVDATKCLGKGRLSMAVPSASPTPCGVI